MNKIEECQMVSYDVCGENGYIGVIRNESIISLTSSYDIRKEEKRFLDKIKTDYINQVIVIFGLGVGNWIFDDKIQKLSKENKLIIIEPSLEVYNLSNLKVKTTFNENITVYIGNRFENFENALKTYEANVDNINVINYGNYANVFKVEYEKVLSEVAEYKVRKMTNQLTLKKLNKLYVNNSFENLFGETDFLAIDTLKQSFKNIPALIVSAGPSLSKQLDKIEFFNGIIITGGRTFGLLSDMGIKCDFFVSTDPTINAYYLVENNMETKVPLVTLLESNSRLIDEYGGEKYLVNTDMSSEENSVFVDEVDSIPIGESVANSSLALADYMGCNPIVLIGQDLAYTSGKHHADQTINKRFDRENSVVESEWLLKVDGYYGEEVVTSNTLIGFLRWFENFIDQEMENEVINCTEGGAEIRGTKQMSFSDYLDSNYNEAPVKNKVIQKRKKVEINRMALIEMKQSLKLMKEVLDDAKKNANQLYRAYTNPLRYEKEVKQLLVKLDEYDKRILSESEKIFFHYAFADAYNDYVNQLESREVNNKNYLEIIAKANSKFYDDMYDEVDYFLKQFNEVDYE